MSLPLRQWKMEFWKHKQRQEVNQQLALQEAQS